MSIKMRFLLSYVGVILISIIVLVVAGFLLIFAITGDTNSIEHLYKKSYVQKPLTTVEESVFLDLKLLAKNNPTQLLNEELLEKIEQKDISIVVRKDTHVEYASPGLDKRTLVKSLPGFEVYKNTTFTVIRKIKVKLHIRKKIVVYFNRISCIDVCWESKSKP